MIEPHIGLFHIERRAIGDHQYLSARFRQRLSRILKPHILADHQTQPHATQHHRAGCWALSEHTLLIEDAIVGQMMLIANSRDRPAIQNQTGIECFASLLTFTAPWGADDQGRTAISRVLRQIVGRFQYGIEKRRAINQILGRIAADRQFREHHQIGF